MKLSEGRGEILWILLIVLDSLRLLEENYFTAPKFPLDDFFPWKCTFLKFCTQSTLSDQSFRRWTWHLINFI